MISRLRRFELRASWVGGNLDIGGRLAWVGSDLKPGSSIRSKLSKKVSRFSFCRILLVSALCSS